MVLENQVTQVGERIGLIEAEWQSICLVVMGR